MTFECHSQCHSSRSQMSWKNVSLKAGKKHDLVLDKCVIIWILEMLIYLFSVSVDLITMAFR
jgi:hypothetical protein